MTEYSTSFEFTSLIALFIYWIPAAICVFVYLFRDVGIYKRELASCENKYYQPELTVGLIVWQILCSLVPAVNLLALVFDCASSVFKWLGKFLNIPLVPKRKAAED